MLCQSGLMFFPDVPQALREMARVTTRAVALQVWERTESQPAYAPWIAVAARHAGPEAIDLLSTYFSRGDLDELSSDLASAGLQVTGTRTMETVLRFGSTDELVMAEVQSTPLADRLSQEMLDRILVDTREALRPFVTDDGALIPIRGHVVTATKR